MQHMPRIMSASTFSYIATAHIVSIETFVVFLTFFNNIFSLAFCCDTRFPSGNNEGPLILSKQFN